ncbi:MAG: hypothetical protein KIS94_14480 [Chitinophagales bacterium]|nr:hypothetical protein [Chitinophagales bacterium]
MSVETSIAGTDVVHRLSAQGKSEEEIERQLWQQGYNPEEICTMLKPLRDARYEKHRKIGLPLLLFGALLCVIGFAVTCFASHGTFEFHFGLYGMTGVGATSVMAGLFLIVG